MIHINERLPEKTDRYNVYGKDKKIPSVLLFNHFTKQWWLLENNQYRVVGGIEYWEEKPEPSILKIGIEMIRNAIARLRLRRLHPKYSAFLTWIANKTIHRRKLNKFREYWGDRTETPLCIKCNAPMKKAESLEMEMKYPDMEGFKCVTDRFIFFRKKMSLREEQ